MSLRTFLKPLSFLPALILMYLIYSFSAQEGDASSALSYKVSYYVVKTADEVLDADLQEWEIESFASRFNGVTRKLAHMTEYFALAVAVSFPLYVYGLHGIPLMLIAGMICVAYACGDEYHQSFVSGRSPSKRDVLIDSFGVFWGIILVRIVGWTGRKTIFRPLRKKKGRNPEEDYPEDEYFGSPDAYDWPYPEDEIPPSVYPPPRTDYNGGRVSTYYNTAQRQSRTYIPEGYDSGRRQDGYAVRSRKTPQRRGGAYGASPYESSQREAFRPQMYDGEQEEPFRGSDKLSQDLSFRKLVHDIKEQHQQDHTQ